MWAASTYIVAISPERGSGELGRARLRRSSLRRPPGCRSRACRRASPTAQIRDLVPVRVDRHLDVGERGRPRRPRAIRRPNRRPDRGGRSPRRPPRSLRRPRRRRRATWRRSARASRSRRARARGTCRRMRRRAIAFHRVRPPRSVKSRVGSGQIGAPLPVAVHVPDAAGPRRPQLRVVGREECAARSRRGAPRPRTRPTRSGRGRSGSGGGPSRPPANMLSPTTIASWIGAHGLAITRSHTPPFSLDAIRSPPPSA